MFDKIKDFFVMRGVENKLRKIFRNPQYLQKIDIYNQILKPCDDILEKNPNNLVAYFCKAELYYVMCDYKNAFQFYNDLQEKSILSNFILKLDSRQRMLDCCDKLIEADPNNPELYVNKAHSLAYTYSIDAAEQVIECYDKAIAFNPDNLAGIVYLKACFLDDVEICKENSPNNSETALSFFDEAIQAYPEHIVDLIYYKAEFLYCYGEKEQDDVLAFFDESAQAYPQHSKEILAKKEEFVKSLEDDESQDIEIPDFLSK